MPLDIYDDEPDGALRGAEARPYIGILFECCGVYARIYRQPDHMVYKGRCPKCLATVRARVSPDGSACRIFRAK